MNETAVNTFQFELVAPEQRLLSEPAWQVVIPGEEGDFGVRVKHCALLSSIRPGVISVWYKADDKPEKIFISGGFADVSADNCTVLAEEAVLVEDLDKEGLEQTLRNLGEDLSLADGEAEMRRIEDKIALVKAKLQAVTGILQA